MSDKDRKARNRESLVRLIRKFEQERGTVVALAEASRYQLLEEIQRILDGGADVNGRDERGATALMLASSSKTAKLLIQHGADVNARDNEGRTPLICFLLGLSPKKQAEAYLRTLVIAGADVDVQTPDGVSARSLAESKYGSRIANLLGGECPTPSPHGREINPETPLTSKASGSGRMLEIRPSPSGIQVHVEGGGSFLLPQPADLKAAALEQAYGWGDSEVAALIQDCDFDYRVVRGKDAFEERIAVVVITSSENVAVLRNEDNPIPPRFWSAIIDACPDIGDSRVVERRREGQRKR